MAPILPAGWLLVGLLVARPAPVLAQGPAPTPPPQTMAALSDPDPLVRMRAVDALEDAEALREVALADRDAEVRARAVSRMHDDASLSRIAAEDSSARVQLLAVGRIEGQEFLGRVARGAPREEVRAAAVERLTDPDVLEEFFRSESWLLRKAAVSRTEDKTLLIEAAVDDPDPYVR
jgi:hypothetical protein